MGGWETWQAELDALMGEHFPGRRAVVGAGQRGRPPLMFIGEAPGGQEEAQGTPFVGQAGQQLQGFLDAVGLKREEIWISNTVKVRPTRISPSGSVANRTPTPQEVEWFLPLLRQEILMVHPGFLVTLGNVPLHALDPEAPTIGGCHGAWRKAVIHGIPIPMIPLYHPASLIYRPALREAYQQDMMRVKERLLHGV